MKVEPCNSTDNLVELLQLPISFMWTDELKNELRKQLNSTDVLNEMNKLFDSSSETEIESLVSNFTNVIVKLSV